MYPQTDYILNLEDGQINKVLFWTKHKSPIITIDDIITKGTSDFMPWLLWMPLVIKTPEEYLEVYKKLVKKGWPKRGAPTFPLPSKYKKHLHPLTLYGKEWHHVIDETWRNKKGMLIAGGYPSCEEGYMSCYISRDKSEIIFSDGDDFYMFKPFENKDKLDSCWEYIQTIAPISENKLKKLGFVYE